MATLPIKTKDGNLSIELERHDKTPDEIPRNPDAIVIEYPYWQQVFDSVEKGNSLESSLTNIEDSKHYLEIISLAKQKGIPLFFPDAAVKSKYVKDYNMKRNLLEGFVGVLALTASGSMILRSIYKLAKKRMTRREFLKEFLAKNAVIAPSLVLLDEFMGSRDLSRKKIIGKGNLEKAFVKAFEALDIDPLIELRSAIMAEKIESFILPEIKRILGRKANVYMLLGRWHAGIEDYFNHSELRRQIFHHFNPLDNYLRPGFRHVGKIKFVSGKPKIKVYENVLKESFNRKSLREHKLRHSKRFSRRDLFRKVNDRIKKPR